MSKDETRLFCVYFMKHPNLNDDKASISTLLTFPRCASQGRVKGVDVVGAATGWESSVEKKDRVEQWERENKV